MGKNIKLLYCILGSFVLALLNSPILSYAKLGMFPGGYAGTVGVFLVLISNILSLIGFLLLILFSIILIINNLNFKEK